MAAGPTNPLGSVPDLGALKGRTEEIPVIGGDPGVYVNDIQPSVGTEGTVALDCRFLSRDGMSDGVRLVMPLPLFVQLVTNGAPVINAAIGRMLATAKDVSEYMDRAQATAEAMVAQQGDGGEGGGGGD